MVLIMPLCVTLAVDFNRMRTVRNVLSSQMSELEQRAVIKFLRKEVCPAKKLYEKLQAAYGDAASVLPSGYFSVKEFKCGPEDIRDQPRPG
jgi:regulator of PEP synthase PpsR (kinase-PPPase family)